MIKINNKESEKLFQIEKGISSINDNPLNNKKMFKKKRRSNYSFGKNDNLDYVVPWQSE